jgi:phosphoribosylformimino-5-aminoimidazole carboxamide ribonucleotide (ProFAR) isomerase
MPILASGGVSSVNDLRALAAIPGVQGVVVGRALYTGAIDLRQALEAV